MCCRPQQSLACIGVAVTGQINSLGFKGFIVHQWRMEPRHVDANVVVVSQPHLDIVSAPNQVIFASKPLEATRKARLA